MQFTIVIKEINNNKPVTITAPDGEEIEIRNIDPFILHATTGELNISRAELCKRIAALVEEK